MPRGRWIEQAGHRSRQARIARLLMALGFSPLDWPDTGAPADVLATLPRED